MSCTHSAVHARASPRSLHAQYTGISNEHGSVPCHHDGWRKVCTDYTITITRGALGNEHSKRVDPENIGSPYCTWELQVLIINVQCTVMKYCDKVLSESTNTYCMSGEWWMHSIVYDHQQHGMPERGYTQVTLWSHCWYTQVLNVHVSWEYAGCIVVCITDEQSTEHTQCTTQYKL